jgi:FMN phosphatase YigB (HAD superfamily)
MKPHPHVFEHATKLTGYQPEEILYIGDSFTSDVTGGTDFGWKVAWFTDNGEAEKHRKADLIFNDFKNLTKVLKV